MEIIKKVNLTNRIYLLDLLRGLAIILMILDHFVYDYIDLMPVFFSNISYSDSFSLLLIRYFNSSLRLIGRNIVLFNFMFVSGICCTLSTNNLNRGKKLLIVALVISAVSLVFGDILHFHDLFIVFGVLHCISLSLIIIGLMYKYNINNKWIYFTIGVILLSIGLVFKFVINNGTLPFVRYKDKYVLLNILKGIIGLVSIGSDCFAITLYGGEIFLGVFVGKLLYKEKSPKTFKKYINDPITFVGRNSLLFYIAHQIIIPIIMVIIFLLLGYSFQI